MQPQQSPLAPGTTPMPSMPQAQQPQGSIAAPVPQAKKGMPVWAIVLIVGGVMAVIGMVLIGGLMLEGIATKGRSSTSLTETNSANTTDTGSTSQYANSRISFKYPDHYSPIDLSNVKVAMVDGTVQDMASFKGANAKVKISYYEISSSNQVSTTEIPLETRVNGMQQAVTSYTALSESRLLDMVGSYGFGCINKLLLTRQPKVLQRDQLVGIDFEYECPAMDGSGMTVNRRTQFYDKTGTRHLLVVSMSQDYATSHRGELILPADSFALK